MTDIYILELELKTAIDERDRLDKLIEQLEKKIEIVKSKFEKV